MSMADLVAAGAPALPAGHFYRVRLESFGLVKVEVRRQGRWLSEPVEHTYVRPADYETAEDAIVAGCRRAVAWWEERQGAALAQDAVRRLVGDHDPKGGRS
jgi:DNA-binding protein YbaB